MTTIHLGILDVPYAERDSDRGGKVKSGTQTTGDVAQWLEDKYDVMGNFVKAHEKDIADDMAESVAGALETLMTGGPVDADPLAEGMSGIETRFRKFLDDNEIAGMGVEGVPTAASLRGVNHRLKVKKGTSRPSFIDTGLYQSTFKAWAV